MMNDEEMRKKQNSEFKDIKKNSDYHNSPMATFVIIEVIIATTIGTRNDLKRNPLSWSQPTR